MSHHIDDCNNVGSQPGHQCRIKG